MCLKIILQVALCLTCVLSLRAAQPDYLSLQPQPKQIQYSELKRRVPRPVYVVLASDAPVVFCTAAQMLRDSLGKSLRVYYSVKVLTPRNFTREKAVQDKQPLTCIRFEKAEAEQELPPEGYQIESAEKNGAFTFIIRGNDNGIIYGALTLLDVLAQTTRANGGKPAAPASFSISDWPTFTTRMRVTVTRYRDNTMPDRVELDKAFAGMSRMRLNATWAPAEYEWLNMWVQAAARYDIKVWGHFGFVRHYAKLMGRVFCPSDPADMAMLERDVIALAKQGIHGISFNFDDIEWLNLNGKRTRAAFLHARLCPKCAKNFGTMGRMQNAILKRVVATGRKHGIKEFIVCPSPYRRGDLQAKRYQDPVWSNYFPDLLAGGELKDMKCFHCEFEANRLEELQAHGLRNYMYWVNGLWLTDRWFSCYTGLTRLGYTWYGFGIDPVAGPRIKPGVMRSFRELDRFTKSVFFGTSTVNGLYLGGIWAWNPKAYDEQRARKVVCEKLYGPNVYAPLCVYEKNMLKLVVYFKTYINRWTRECEVMVADDRRLPGLPAMQEALKKAEAAYEKIKKQSPEMPELARMKQALANFSGKLRAKAEKAETIRRLVLNYGKRTRQSGQNLVAWWRFDDKDNLGQDSGPHGIACKFEGKPTPVEGVVDGAAKFHGGQMKNIKGVGVAVRGVKEYLHAPVTPELAMAEGSFSVELWINFHGPNQGGLAHNQFIGTRNTHANWYRSRGWSLGSGKSKDDIRFTVDDGKNIATIAVSTRSSPIDLDGWVYIVAVRDRERGELRLYVNGKEPVKPVKDTTMDVSSKGPLVIGYDYMTGCCLNGSIDEIRITARSLDKTDIAFDVEDVK